MILGTSKPMSWYRIKLKRQEYESGEMVVLLGAFRAAYVARNGPVGMAMLGCWAEDGDSYHVYITPKSVRHIIPILDAYAGKPSKTPEFTQLDLLFGEEADFSSMSEIELEA